MSLTLLRLSQLSVVPEAIEASLVTDVDGNTWQRIPATWVETADLCAASSPLVWNGEDYRTVCRERSVWACGDVGLCPRHFARLVSFGDEG